MTNALLVSLAASVIFSPSPVQTSVVRTVGQAAVMAGSATVSNRVDAAENVIDITQRATSAVSKNFRPAIQRAVEETPRIVRRTVSRLVGENNGREDPPVTRTPPQASSGTSSQKSQTIMQKIQSIFAWFFSLIGSIFIGSSSSRNS